MKYAQLVTYHSPAGFDSPAIVTKLNDDGTFNLFQLADPSQPETSKGYMLSVTAGSQPGQAEAITDPAPAPAADPAPVAP